MPDTKTHWISSIIIISELRMRGSLDFKVLLLLKHAHEGHLMAKKRNQSPVASEGKHQGASEMCPIFLKYPVLF